MRRKVRVGVGLAMVVLFGAGASAWYVQSRFSPSRLLGWTPANAAAETGQDSLLGFSRYLPEEVSHYGAALQSGRLWKSFAGSNAIRRLAEVPAVKTFLAEAGEELHPGKVPRGGRQAPGLLPAALRSALGIPLPPGAAP